jgi:hypothetical protein
MSPSSQNTVLPSNGHCPSNIASTSADNTNTNNTEDISTTDTRSGVVDEYARLFGKQLPDPIHLRTEIGTSDGEVIFIAHPNRDVSAHQWSQTSFQWVNIGLYSHNRRKIEGSLALERLRGPAMPYNTIEYFKAAAEQRQADYRTGYRSDPRPPETTGAQHLETLRRPTLSDVEHFASLSSASGSATDQLPTLSRLETINKDSGEPATPPSHTVAGEALEDPFVTPAGAAQHTIPKMFGYAQDNHGESGSMDFGYEFPAKAALQHSVVQSQQSQVFVQREQDRLAAMRGGNLAQVHAMSNVRDVGFREESLSSFGSYGRRPTLGRLAPMTTVVDPTPNLDEVAESIHRQTNSVTASGVHAMRGRNNELLPARGRTVANPNRVASTLNARAPPYTHTPTPLSNQTGNENESEGASVYAQPTVNLKYSDPDSTRPPHAQEIANGIAQKAPTPQNFKGPFFTDHMPTALNPVTSLAYQVEEEAKLRNWYHDGQRPARQQEFCRSIMATGNVNVKSRNQHHFGAIGESSAQVPSNYDNTPIFVRLYENLSKYADESRAGRGQDYFTHAWKPPLVYQRDLGPDGNDSFFQKKKFISPLQARSYNMNLQAFAASNWRDLR